MVKDKNGDYSTELNPAANLKVRINEDYAKLANKARNEAEKIFFKDHLKEAKWFKQSIDNRNDTLLKVGRCIVSHQKDFMEKGESAMHPMVLKLWEKYSGNFPHLCDKGRTNDHLRECARLAKVEDEVRIVENRGGKVQTLTYKKYQLVGMHTGRRSFATNMYKRRFPTIAIMKLTGHTTESNFLRYIKVTPEENAAMMADEFFKAQQPFENEF